MINYKYFIVVVCTIYVLSVHCKLARGVLGTP